MRQHALIFDFGNVFAHFSYTKACEEIGRKRGVSGEDLIANLRESGLNDWVSLYETGQMSSTEFADQVTRASRIDLDFDEFSTAWRDIFWLNEPVVDLVRHLHCKGYPLVLGSNTNELHAEHFQTKFREALEPFQALVFSYQLGKMKPDPRFYHACVSAAGRVADSCIFIDDLEANVQGAIDAGLEGIHYREFHQVVEDLQLLGIEVD